MNAATRKVLGGFALVATLAAGVLAVAGVHGATAASAAGRGTNGRGRHGPGMPPVADPRNLYSEIAAGKIEPGAGR